ncbi:MAG: hypothetical protein JXA41_07275 [Deltaproteobacteria bacterium]|nr:hypothetical protein [Deltaproteobacteria bacterium]
MILSGKNVDKFISTLIYVGLLGLVMWGGNRVVNYALESRFQKDFLLKWTVAVMSYSVERGQWPQFTGSNHIQYMDNLVTAMTMSHVNVPASNTKRPYIYKLKKIGSPEEKIFVLCFSDRLILYGLSEKTFKRIDTWIDGKFDEKCGKFRGRPSADGKTFIGLWRL